MINSRGVGIRFQSQKKRIDQVVGVLKSVFEECV